MDERTIPDDWHIPDDLWEAIAPLLPEHKNTHRFGGGRPRRPDRVCMDAILFVLRTGCQWKALDATKFCPASTAHDRFQEWVEAGVFQALGERQKEVYPVGQAASLSPALADRLAACPTSVGFLLPLALWDHGLMAYDDFQGIDWSWLSMDGCMTKAPFGGEKTGKNPTDRAKQGAKRSLLVEAEGIPVGLAVDGANRPDMKMVEETLDSIPVERPQPTAEAAQGLCLDLGYDYDEVQEIAEKFYFTTHLPPQKGAAEKVKRKASHKARRWVVERTHSWMNRFRGVLVRWSKKAENYMALLHMSFAFIIYKRMGLTG